MQGRAASSSTVGSFNVGRCTHNVKPGNCEMNSKVYLKAFGQTGCEM